MSSRVFRGGAGTACVALLILVVMALSANGASACACGEFRGPVVTRLLTASEVKRALRPLPYRFEFRSVALPAGAYSAIAGTAVGRHETAVNFGIAFGRSTEGVPVPPAGTDSAFAYRNLFVYTDDLQWRNAKGRLVTTPRLKTGTQWREAWRISVDITDRLCKSATGKPCPV